MGLLDSFLKKWQERGVRKTVVEIQARNEQLRQVLLSYGVNLLVPRPIDLHFWALGEENARILETALRSRGCEIKACAPAVQQSGSALWNVEATVNLAPIQVLSDAFTEDLVRMAVESGSKYDGWGTAVPEGAVRVEEEAHN